MITVTVKTPPVKKKLSNEKDWPAEYSCNFLEAGIVSYEDSNAGITYLTKETIGRMAPTFIGKPVLIDHHDVTPETFKTKAVGYVTRVWFNEADGWYHCAFILTDDKAKELVARGYSVSCAFDVLSTAPGGEWHAIKYDDEVTDGCFTHLAIVSNPRYEGCRIYHNSKGAGTMKIENTGPRIEKRKFEGRDVWAVVSGKDGLDISVESSEEAAKKVIQAIKESDSRENDRQGQVIRGPINGLSLVFSEGTSQYWMMWKGQVIQKFDNKDQAIYEFEKATRKENALFTAMVKDKNGELQAHDFEAKNGELQAHDFEAKDHADAEKIAKQKWGNIEGVVQNSKQNDGKRFYVRRVYGENKGGWKVVDGTKSMSDSIVASFDSREEAERKADEMNSKQNAKASVGDTVHFHHDVKNKDLTGVVTNVDGSDILVQLVDGSSCIVKAKDIKQVFNSKENSKYRLVFQGGKLYVMDGETRVAGPYTDVTEAQKALDLMSMGTKENSRFAIGDRVEYRGKIGTVKSQNGPVVLIDYDKGGEARVTEDNADLKKKGDMTPFENEKSIKCAQCGKEVEEKNAFKKGETVYCCEACSVKKEGRNSKETESSVIFLNRTPKTSAKEKSKMFKFFFKNKKNENTEVAHKPEDVLVDVGGGKKVSVKELLNAKAESEMETLEIGETFKDDKGVEHNVADLVKHYNAKKNEFGDEDEDMTEDEKKAAKAKKNAAEEEEKAKKEKENAAAEEEKKEKEAKENAKKKAEKESGEFERLKSLRENSLKNSPEMTVDTMSDKVARGEALFGSKKK